MFTRIITKRKSYGILYSAVLLDAVRPMGRAKHDFVKHLGSIRAASLNDWNALCNFWRRVNNIFYENGFTKTDVEKFYESIMRTIHRRPRRIVGSETGIHFIYHTRRGHYTQRRKC